MGRNHHSLGLVAMLVASALFAVMNVLVRVASDQYGLDSFKMGVFRFAIGLSLLGLAAMLGKINLQFVNSPILVLRGLLGGLGVLGLYLSITYLGVAKGTVVSYTYPVFAMIGSVIVLRETAPVGQWAGAAGAFAGIFLIASAKSDGQSAMAGGQWAWYLVAIVGAACAGMAVVLVRKLRSTDSSYAIFFSQCVMGLWLTVIPANLKPVELNLAGGLLLVAIGITAASAQLLFTYAYAHITVATGSILGNLVPVLSAAAGFTLFDEPMSARTVIGMALVVGSCGLVMLRREQVSRMQ